MIASARGWQGTLAGDSWGGVWGLGAGCAGLNLHFCWTRSGTPSSSTLDPACQLGHEGARREKYLGSQRGLDRIGRCVGYEYVRVVFTVCETNQRVLTSRPGSRTGQRAADDDKFGHRTVDTEEVVYLPVIDVDRDVAHKD